MLIPSSFWMHPHIPPAITHGLLGNSPFMDVVPMNVSVWIFPSYVWLSKGSKGLSPTAMFCFSPLNCHHTYNIVPPFLLFESSSLTFHPQSGGISHEIPPKIPVESSPGQLARWNESVLNEMYSKQVTSLWFVYSVCVLLFEEYCKCVERRWDKSQIIRVSHCIIHQLNSRLAQDSG